MNFPTKQFYSEYLKSIAEADRNFSENSDFFPQTNDHKFTIFHQSHLIENVLIHTHTHTIHNELLFIELKMPQNRIMQRTVIISILSSLLS